MRRLALAACIYLAIAHPHAAEMWTYGSSDHFEVYTTGGDKRARAALAYFERVHAFFADFLKLAPQQRHPTRLIVFSNDREYAPYRPNAGVVAFYAPGPDRDYIVMRSMDPEAYPIVVHEYAHLIVRHSGSGGSPRAAKRVSASTLKAARGAGRGNAADVVGRTRSGSRPASSKTARAKPYQEVRPDAVAW